MAEVAEIIPEMPRLLELFPEQLSVADSIF